MKKITINSATKKLNKLVESKKVNKTSIVYGWINEIIGGKKEFRPVYSQGSSWKNSTLFDRRIEFTSILNKIGIEFTQSNDSPRGGKTGAKIDIITKVKA